jgi:hypothetical protein
MNIKEFLSGNNGKELPKELRGFNWGAFILTFIWGYFHKAWVTMLAIPLIIFQMPLGINWILLTVLQIYCGIKGNEWAYQHDFWMTPAQFRMKQIKWGVFAMALSVVLPLSFMLVFARFMSKSEDNPQLLLQNAQCTVAYQKIKKHLKYSYMESVTSADDVAYEFAKEDKEATASDDTVLYGSSAQGVRVDYFMLKFTKPANELCKFEKQNCKIEASFVIPDDIIEMQPCIFYMDNFKKIKPDEFTQNAIDKGFNIIKYL